MAERRGEVTVLLSKVKNGDSNALPELMSLLYPELHRIAARHVRRERQNHTLQPTALVNEAYLELADGVRIDWQDRIHFLAVAGQMMRRVLVDYARGRRAEKRGGGQVALQLDEALAVSPEAEAGVIELEEALQRLEQADPLKARVVELRFFGGLSVEETAEALHLGERTVKRYWNAARARLRRDLSNGGSKSQSASA